MHTDFSHAISESVRLKLGLTAGATLQMQQKCPEFDCDAGSYTCKSGEFECSTKFKCSNSFKECGNSY